MILEDFQKNMIRKESRNEGRDEGWKEGRKEEGREAEGNGL